MPLIRKAHKDNIGVYGVRKIHAELVRRDVTVARCTVERLMRSEGLRGIPREKSHRTTISDGAETERPADLVDREFIAKAPDQWWVADFERHEAFLDRAVVKGHRWMPVAAGI